MKKVLCLLISFSIISTLLSCSPKSEPELPSSDITSTAETKTPDIIAAEIEAPEISMAEIDTPETSEDGYIHIVMPENLLAGKKAEKAFDWDDPDVQRDLAPLLTSSYVNEDNSATFVFTPEQFENYRRSMFKYVTLPRYQSLPFLESVDLMDDMLTQIHVVSRMDQLSDFTDWFLISTIIAVYAGHYQVLSGVDPDEWKTTITYINYYTGEAISLHEPTGEVFYELTFPNDRMYSVYSIN